MRISICSKKIGFNKLVDERFGRAENFTVVDLDTNIVETIENIAKNNTNDTEEEVVKLLSKHRVDIAVVSHLSPRAEKAMEAFEIKIISQGECKSVGDVLEAYKAGKLKAITR